ncbi:MAG: hypothetical protein ACXWM7_00380 [Parachlamydiaceae bacterium]
MSLSLSVSVRILCCIVIAVIFIYEYIEKQNALTELRLMIPVLTKELKSIQEENISLQYAIDTFENPVHLLKLMRQPQYSHLKYQSASEVFVLPSHHE